MDVGNKIKKFREQRNYTQQYMSDRLNISQNTYSKIETGGIKLTVERLNQIAEVLEVPIEQILSSDNQVFNFNNSQVEKFYGYIETLHEDNKELTQKTIEILNSQLEYLKKENEKLISQINKKS